MQKIISLLNQGTQLTVQYSTMALKSPVAIPFATVVVALHLGGRQTESERNYRPSGKLIGSALVWATILTCIKTFGGSNPVTPEMVKAVGAHTLLFVADGVVVSQAMKPGKKVVAHFKAKVGDRVVDGDHVEIPSGWTVNFGRGLLIAVPWLLLRGTDAWLRATQATNAMPMEALFSKVIGSGILQKAMAAIPRQPFVW